MDSVSVSCPPQATFCALFQCAAAAGAAWHKRRFGGAGGEGTALHLDAEHAAPMPGNYGGSEAAGRDVTDVWGRGTGDHSNSSGGGAVDSLEAEHAMDGPEASSHAATGSIRYPRQRQQQQQPIAAGFAMEAEEQDAFVQQQLWLEERQVWVTAIHCCVVCCSPAHTGVQG